MRKFKYQYKTKGQVKPSDTQDYLYLIDGVVPETGLPLKYSREVALEPLSRRKQRGAVLYSEDASHNRMSSRVNTGTGRTLDKGIQLYRLWFRFLKLALELEELGVELVVQTHNPRITRWNEIDGIPKSIIDRARKEREESNRNRGDTGIDAIFRCKVIQRIKVKKSAYKGWDLDQVLADPFDKWWKTHSHLFEGFAPTFIDPKDDLVVNDDFLYIRIDKTSQWRDIQAFMSSEVSKRIKGGSHKQYKVVGRPRVNVIQNNYNALVLSLKGWSSKEIYTHKNIYLRKTDESINSGRTEGEKLTLRHDPKGKPLYSTTVSPQRQMGIHHLLEVCDGRFGLSPPSK